MILIDVCILAVRSRSLYTVKDTPWLSHFAWNFLLEDLTLSFSLCNGSVLLRNYHLILQFFFFPGKTLLGSLMQQRGVRTGNMFPCLFACCRERACPYMGWGRGVLRGQAGGVAWVICPPSGGGECRRYVSYSAFVPNISYSFYFFGISWLSRQGTSKLTSFQLFIKGKNPQPFQHSIMLRMIYTPPTTSNGVPITIHPASDSI